MLFFGCADSPHFVHCHYRFVFTETVIVQLLLWVKFSMKGPIFTHGEINAVKSLSETKKNKITNMHKQPKRILIKSKKW